MIKIVLCCSAGMSTSLFVQKLKNYAQSEGIAMEVDAISVAELDTYKSPEVSVYVLAPQVKFQLADVIERVKPTPVFVIDMRDYGLMNVQKVLPQLLEAAKG